MSSVPGQRFCLYDAAQLEVVLDLMVAQASALLAGAEDPLLLGVLRRGAPEIRAAVLVDRCVARLPVHADIVGVSLQVASDDVVECHL